MMIAVLHGGHGETQERYLNLVRLRDSIHFCDLHSSPCHRSLSGAFPSPVAGYALSPKPYCLHLDWQRGYGRIRKQGCTPCSRRNILSREDEEAFVFLLRPAASSSVLFHGTTGRQSSIDLVVTTGRRRCAVRWFLRNSNSTLRCGYWTQWMSGRVIRAVVATRYFSLRIDWQTGLIWMPTCQRNCPLCLRLLRASPPQLAG